MTQKTVWGIVTVCGLTTLGFSPATAADGPQGMEVKEKAPMYSYIANWEVPRDKFKDIESQLDRNNALMGKHLSGGGIVGFGNDITLIHQDNESTHDVWWSSMSWGGLMKTLEAVKAAGSADAP